MSWSTEKLPALQCKPVTTTWIICIVFIGEKKIGNCSKFYRQGHLLRASLLPRNMCLSFKVSCMNKAGFQIGADKSQILGYKPMVQAEMNVLLLLPRTQLGACYSLLLDWLWLLVLVLTIQKSGLSCPIFYLLMLFFSFLPAYFSTRLER